MSDALLAPWVEAIDEFPVCGSPAEKLRAAARLATLAPSSHNSQPWVFRVKGTSVELFADRSRALPVVDPEDRELTISCGAALYYLRLSLGYFGHLSRTTLLPDPNDPDLMARVTIGRSVNPDPRTQQLFRAVRKRRTNRNHFESTPIPSGVILRAFSAAAVEGAWVDLFPDGRTKERIADFIAEADRIQMADPALRRELARWMHPNRRPTRDGMPGYAHRLGDLASEVAPGLVRRFDLGRPRAARDRDLAMDAPALAVVWTRKDTPADWLLAGQALAAMLLSLQADGVAASFLNQAIEVAAVRQELLGMLRGFGLPQLLLRLGYGKEALPTLRRDAHDVVFAPEVDQC